MTKPSDLGLSIPRISKEQRHWLPQVFLLGKESKILDSLAVNE